MKTIGKKGEIQSEEVLIGNKNPMDFQVWT